MWIYNRESKCQFVDKKKIHFFFDFLTIGSNLVLIFLILQFLDRPQLLMTIYLIFFLIKLIVFIKINLFSSKIIKFQQIANTSIQLIIIIWLFIIFQKYMDIEIQTNLDKMSRLYNQYQIIGQSLTFFIFGAIILNFGFVLTDIFIKI